MNRLPAPNFFDDHIALNDLANNRRAGSFPQLQGHVAEISAGYTNYIASNGNATKINAVTIPNQIAIFLRKHYASPPLNIAYIDEIRERSGAATCPMCGSFGCGTLDHVLPKEDYPAFAIFGLNLVPACNCNQQRGRALLGPNPGERILHPYFDDILGQRLLKAHFANLGLVPSISTTLLIPQAHPQYTAADFHLRKVVQRTHIDRNHRRLWNMLIRKPGSLIPHLRTDPSTRADLIKILKDELSHKDEFHESLNNWTSIFLMGILNDDVVDWLFHRFSQPGRNPNDALIS